MDAVFCDLLATVASELKVICWFGDGEKHLTWPCSVTSTLYLIGFGGSGSQVDSARMNLASSFVNGFVNAAFGQDKLLTDDGNKWLYKNKDHGKYAHKYWSIFGLQNPC